MTVRWPAPGPSRCAARWPEERGAGRAAGQQTSDSNPAPSEQGWKSGGHLGRGPAVVTGPCVFSLAGAWGRASHMSLCKAGFWPPCSGLQTCVEGWQERAGVPGSLSSLLVFTFLPRGSELGNHWKHGCPVSWCVLLTGQLAQVGRGTLCSEETSPGSMEVALRPSGPREGGGGGGGASDWLML